MTKIFASNHMCLRIVLPSDCQLSGLDGRLYCITYYQNNGILNTKFDAYEYDNIHSLDHKYRLYTTSQIASAEDMAGSPFKPLNGHQTVTCGKHAAFFGLSHLALGPAAGTLALDVEYADAPMIEAACAPDAATPNDPLRSPPRPRASLHQSRDGQEGALGLRYVLGRVHHARAFHRRGWGRTRAPSGERCPHAGDGQTYRARDRQFLRLPKSAGLTNPSADAGAVAEKLRKLGFSDVKLLENADENTLLRALDAFAGAATSADWAVVFFAGHGLAVGGKNYVVPIDATLASDTQVAFEVVSLDQWVNATSGARGLRLVILDVCRDNPFVRKMVVAGGSRSLSRGFVVAEPDAGTLVVYAARDGASAKDGDGDHSPFTAALWHYLGEPNLELNLLFRKVRDDATHLTNNEQEPSTYGSLPATEFYFSKTVGK